MKITTGEYYEVKDKMGMYGLVQQVPTLEGAIVLAEEDNRQKIEKGFKSADYIITKTVWSRQYDDNGMFVFEDIHTSRAYQK